MENNLKYFFKRDKCEVNVPVTTEFPKGKKVWNIGKNNPYIDEGYVILCNDDEDCFVKPESLEFLYVATAADAYTLHEAAGYMSINVDNIDKMRTYRRRWGSEIVHEAAELIEKFRKKDE